MQVFDLKGEVRNDLGKKATKAVRYAEKVPCVLYGGEANVHFAVLDKDLKKLLYTPNVYLVNLDQMCIRDRGVGVSSCHWVSC